MELAAPGAQLPMLKVLAEVHCAVFREVRAGLLCPLNFACGEASPSRVVTLKLRVLLMSLAYTWSAPCPLLLLLNLGGQGYHVVLESETASPLEDLMVKRLQVQEGDCLVVHDGMGWLA